MADTNTIDILRRVRKRIEKPENWTQGESARDGTGAAVIQEDPSATRWCLGAAAEIEGHAAGVGYSVRNLLVAQLGGGWAADISFNDTHTHAEVLDLIDRTIVRLESREVKVG